jgi:hypothetical protein
MKYPTQHRVHPKSGKKYEVRFVACSGVNSNSGKPCTNPTQQDSDGIYRCVWHTIDKARKHIHWTIQHAKNPRKPKAPKEFVVTATPPLTPLDPGASLATSLSTVDEEMVRASLLKLLTGGGA